MKEDVALPAGGQDADAGTAGRAVDFEARGTQRQASEAEILDLLHRYRDLFDLAPVGYLTLDAASTILEANLTAADMVGIERGALVGAEFSSVFHPLSQDAYFLDMRRLLHVEGRYTCELRLASAEATETWVHIDFTVATDERYGVRRAWCVMSDVSERKQAERELVTSRDRLKELAARLHADREADEVRMARTLHDKLGQDLSALGIDLSVLKGTLKGVQDEGDQAERTELVGEMQDLISGCVQTLNEALVTLRPPALDVLGLKEAIEFELERLQREHGVLVTADLPAEGIHLKEESKTVVFQIFREGLSNVLSHATAQRVSVSVRRSEWEMLLELVDDGVGIAEGAVNRPTSVGLIDAQERAIRIGGQLIVEPADGRGTRFCLKVPTAGLGSSS